MKKQPSHNRHMLSKNSILLLVMLVCIFLSTLAWFTSLDNATATGLTFQTKTPATLELALPNEDGSYPTEDSAYKPTLEFDKMENILKIMEADVTSDGLHFIIPTTTQGDGVRRVQKDKNWKKAIANGDYVSIPFYIRSQDPDICVSKYSQVNAALTDSTGNIVNKSDISGISRNGIVGAMRVSIIDMTKSITDSNYKPNDGDNKLLWIPRPDLYLDTPQTSNWRLLTNIQKTTTLPEGARAEETYKHSYWKIRNNSEIGGLEGTGVDEITFIGAVPSEYKADNVTPSLGNDCQIGNGKLYDPSGNLYEMTKVKMGENEKEYYVYKFVMNIWIEGSDAEARRLLNKGEFNIDISFCTKTGE